MIKGTEKLVDLKIPALFDFQFFSSLLPVLICFDAFDGFLDVKQFQDRPDRLTNDFDDCNDCNLAVRVPAVSSAM